MFRTYLGDEDRYRQCFRDGFYLSGDMVRRDADGYFWFLGRADDVIKSAGHLIGPAEVEGCLTEHPAVVEAAVDAFQITAYGCDSDWDGDGVANPGDNCPLVDNPLQEDTDLDGVGDSCDVCWNDANNDQDSDGLCGDVDNCPGIANQDQADPDADSIGTLCDNCPTVYNPDQADLNENNVGDVCEDCCSGSSVGDTDCSGLVDIADIQTLINNQFLTLAPLWVRKNEKFRKQSWPGDYIFPKFVKLIGTP